MFFITIQIYNQLQLCLIASNKSSFVLEAMIISVNLGWGEGLADFLAAGLMTGLGAATLNIVGDLLRLFRSRAVIGYELKQ